MAIVSIDQARKVAITDTGREVPLSDDILENLNKKANRSATFEKDRERILGNIRYNTGPEGSMPGELAAAAGSAVSWGGLYGLGDKGVDMAKGGYAALERREGQEKMSFLERMGENYQASREASMQGFGELSEKYPKSSFAGGALGVVGDIVLSKYMPQRGALAAPIYGAGISDVNPIEEPGKWLGGRAVDVGAGYAIDKVVGGLSRVAGQRARHRAHPEAVRQAEEANALAMQTFREAEAETQAAMRRLPAEQQQSRRLYGNRVRTEAGKLGREMSVTEIPKDSIKVESFVNDTINASEIAGSSEGKKLTNFFTSVVESRPENMGWKDLAKVINAVEDRIIVANEAELPHLIKFKEHLVEVIPRAVGEASAKRKYSTRIMNSIIRDVDSEVSQLLKSDAVKKYMRSTFGKNGEKTFRRALKKEVKGFFNNVSNEEFSYLVNSGELGNEIVNVISNSPSLKALSEGIGRDSSAKVLVKGKALSDLGFIEQAREQMLRQSGLSGREFGALSDGILERVSSSTERFANDMAIEADHTAEKVSNRLKKITGMAEELPAPVAPTAPTLQPIPEQEAMGFLGNLAERPMGSFVPKMRGRGGSAMIGGAIGSGLGIAKAPLVAGIAAGGAAAGAGTLGALKLATAPGVLGDITRRGISYFGKTFPSYLQNKYESFEDGVLKSPEDRLNASIEIENDPYLSNQNKAIWQTKINKGQRI